jgi:hypothetical protein
MGCIVQSSKTARDKYSLSLILRIWWSFFWRFALLFTILLLAGGFCLNFLAQHGYDSKYLILLNYAYSTLANAVSSLVVLLFILNRRFGKSAWKLASISQTPSFWNKLFGWFQYYWRFVLFTFALALLLGGTLPFLAQALGRDPVSFLKYSSYVGNISIIPASWLAFSLVLRQQKRKQAFQIISAF